MNRPVILLTNARAETAGELFEVLNAANISFLTEDWRESRTSGSSTWNDNDPDSCQPLAVLYEVRVDSNTEELALVIRCANTEWPSVPVIACRVKSTEGRKRGATLPTTEQLKRLGFRAIADSPAQLPALLRQVEEIPGTGALRPPDNFRSSPERGAFSLPTHARRKDLRTAFALLASYHLASTHNVAAQVS